MVSTGWTIYGILTWLLQMLFDTIYNLSFAKLSIDDYVHAQSKNILFSRQIKDYKDR